MKTHSPDRWAIVEIHEKHLAALPPAHKILAVWDGDRTKGVGRSWKLSSGIELVHTFANRFAVTQRSGNMYLLSKEPLAYCTTGYVRKIHKHFCDQLAEIATVDLLDADVAYQLLLGKADNVCDIPIDDSAG